MRACPEQGVETKAAVEHVDRVLQECDRRGIDPMRVLEDAVYEYDYHCGPLPQMRTT